MKIEIETDEIEAVYPILIKPNTTTYGQFKNINSWVITDIDVAFGEIFEEDDENKRKAMKLCDLIIDLCLIEYWGREDKQHFYDLVRKTLQEKLELIETATA